MRIVAWLLAAPVVLWAVIRIGGLDRGYPLVPLVSFTPYATAASAVVVLALAALRQWRPALLALAGTLALAAVVVPRAMSGGGDAGGPRLRVMTANVLVGSVEAGTLVDMVRERRVDILSVQELTPEFDSDLREAGLAKLLPHDVLAPEAGATGTGIYSRLPLRALEPPEGSVFNQVAARTRWDPAGSLDVVSVHPPPPVSNQHVDQWRQTLRGLPRNGGRRRLLLGDFNATLDHREMRRLVDDGYEDAAAATGDGLRMTWPDDRSRPPIAIDHVLATTGFLAVEVDVIRLPGGDHRAVYAELVCRNASGC
jgi:endonuclease/exonuclease/phosphatase (EEP) superfamily protein YafD